MPEADAKKRALDVISGMHFGNGGNDYLIIWGMSPEVPSLASGARTAQPQAPGTPQIDKQDQAGRYFVRELVSELQRSGQVLQHILWTRPGSQEKVTKSNFAKVYRPWNMLVMTGMFGDDIAIERNAAMYQAAGATVVLVLLLGVIAVWIASGIARPLGHLRTAMIELAEHRPITVELATGRKDEIGEMARAVEVFRDNARARDELEAQARADAAARAAADEKARQE